MPCETIERLLQLQGSGQDDDRVGCNKIATTTCHQQRDVHRSTASRENLETVERAPTPEEIGVEAAADGRVSPVHIKSSPQEAGKGLPVWAFFSRFHDHLPSLSLWLCRKRLKSLDNYWPFGTHIRQKWLRLETRHAVKRQQTRSKLVSGTFQSLPGSRRAENKTP